MDYAIGLLKPGSTPLKKYLFNQGSTPRFISSNATENTGFLLSKKLKRARRRSKAK